MQVRIQRVQIKTKAILSDIAKSELKYSPGWTHLQAVKRFRSKTREKIADIRVGLAAASASAGLFQLPRRVSIFNGMAPFF